MCVIVDTDTFATVFNETSSRHAEFKPVFDWIYNGRGCLVYGGTKYIAELEKADYIGTILQLSIAQKAKMVSSADVDAAQVQVEARIKHKNFNDPHIVALLLVSGCKIICSSDKKAYPFFTSSEFFKPSSKKPKIYSGRRNANLLTNDNIADICKGSKKLTVMQKSNLSKLK